MGDVTVRGALVFGGDAATTRDLVVHDGRVAAAGAPARGAVIDATGLFVAPGLVDLQVNGHAAVDLVAHPEQLWAVGAGLLDEGVTAFLPTLVSSPPDRRAAARRALVDGPPAGWVGAWPLGWHLEGPVIARAQAGAHDAEAVTSVPPEDHEQWTDEWVRLVTLAPELPGAPAFIDELVRRGITVALGHTAASAECAVDAIGCGASMVTHLFNAMAPMHHRDPGIVGVALTDDRVVVTLIADGRHVDPRAVDVAWRAIGPERFALVSDAVATTLGGRPVRAGELAGGAVPLLTMVRNLVQFTGCSPEQALHAAAGGPARAIGAADRGHLRPGARGDLLLLTPDLTLVGVVLGGEVVRRP